MADLILINAIRVTPPGLVWPGTHVDTVNDVQTYNLWLGAGGIFWPASDAVVAAQAALVEQRRLAGVLDLPTAQAMLLSSVLSVVSAAGTTLIADLASTVLGKGTALIGDNGSGGTLASKLNEIGGTALPTVDTAADATHYGVSKLSVAPAVAFTPIAAGINDPAFTKLAEVGSAVLPTVSTEATDTNYGIVKLSVAPAVLHTPIALGPNDPAITGALKAATTQLSPNHPLVAGTVTVATLTFSASAKVQPIRNNPDPVAANWGALSITAQTPGAPGSITVTSSNAADTSSVDLLVLDV